MAKTINDESCQRQGARFFLDHFDPPRRSLIANEFFGAVRSGAASVDAVLREVKANTLLKMMFAGDREHWNTQHQLLSLLEGEEARRYAKEVLDREALPFEEKQQQKAQRQEHYRREYMKAQPPTERQRRYLESLGCRTVPSNRLHASELIEERKR